MAIENTKELDLLTWIRDSLKQSADKLVRWRTEASESDDFVAGHQWEESDMNRMKEVQKPTITYNRIAPMVNAILGTEIQNRQKMLFVPRHPTDEAASGASDLATEAYDWALEQCGGEYERTQAFRDMIVRGIGWVNLRMDYEEDPEGKIVLERVDGNEMLFDPDARKQNLEDARWVARQRSMSVGELKELWPDKYDEVRADDEANQSVSSVSRFGGASDPTVVINKAPDHYTKGVQTVVPSDTRDSSMKGHFTVTEFQWRERKPIYRFVDENDQIVILPEKEFNELKKAWKAAGREVPPAIKQYRWNYRRAFITGSTILQEDEDIPFDFFTYLAMTCYWDNKTRVWYGLVRAMKDPQRGANKYFSLGVHLFSVSPKGTLLAESGAFVSPNKAVSDWAKPGAIVHLKPGALGQGMVKVEPSPPFPEAASTMIQYSLESLRDVTGINVEMLGQSEGQEGGPAITKRQIQGLTIMAPIFHAFARYREKEALSVLAFLRLFLTDGRWIRIGGPYNSQYLQLVQDHLADEYDLSLDDAPTDPGQKAAVWEHLQPLLPMLFRQGTSPLALLDYAPLPASVISAIKREIEDMKAKGEESGPPPVKKDENPDFIAAEIDLKQANAELSRARAQALGNESQMDIATGAQTIQLREQDAKIQKRQADDNTLDQISNVSKLNEPKGFGVRPTSR